MSEHVVNAICSAFVAGFFAGAAWGIPSIPKSTRIAEYSVLGGAFWAIVFGILAYWFYRRAADD